MMAAFIVSYTEEAETRTFGKEAYEKKSSLSNVMIL